MIQEWKSTYHNELPSADYERLYYPPAEAQLDFETMEIEHQGSFKNIKTLILSTPYSNAGFTVALSSESHESLLTGIK